MISEPRFGLFLFSLLRQYSTVYPVDIIRRTLVPLKARGFLMPISIQVVSHINKSTDTLFKNSEYVRQLIKSHLIGKNAGDSLKGHDHQDSSLKRTSKENSSALYHPRMRSLKRETLKFLGFLNYS